MKLYLVGITLYIYILYFPSSAHIHGIQTRAKYHFDPRESGKRYLLKDKDELLRIMFDYGPLPDTL